MSATGSLEVTNGVAVALEIRALLRTEPTGGRTWTIIPAQHPAHPGFPRDLPSDVVQSVSVRNVDDNNFDAITHLEPGLRPRRPAIASLVNLEHLYLEEETLTLDASDFAEHLPNLTGLGVQDAHWMNADLGRLRQCLPDVDVGRIEDRGCVPCRLPIIASGARYPSIGAPGTKFGSGADKSIRA